MQFGVEATKKALMEIESNKRRFKRQEENLEMKNRIAALQSKESNIRDLTSNIQERVE